jgi:transcriptional regulator with XRE-family HTH domain
MSKAPPAPDLQAVFRLRLAEAIAASQLTQAETAAKAGMHRATVSRILAGRRPVTLAAAERLAHALGRQPLQLLR